jgi:hypothetical protein
VGEGTARVQVKCKSGREWCMRITASNGSAFDAERVIVLREKERERERD